jgi:hypothetical protein
MRLPALAAALALAACAPADPPPDAVYRAFARAVSERDSAAAWKLLSARTRAWLDARAQRAAALAPGLVPPSGQRLLLGDAAGSARPVKEIEVLPGGGERAGLRVTDASGATAEVSLVRERGAWRIDLPEPGPG